MKIAYETSSKKNICTIIKHNIPCGASIENTQIKSYTNALQGDPVSAFGGIVAFNKKINILTAKQLVKNFYEVVAAPNYDKKALEILKARKNLRILKVNKFTDKIEKRSIFAGTLIQDVDNKKSTIETIRCK